MNCDPSPPAASARRGHVRARPHAARAAAAARECRRDGTVHQSAAGSVSRNSRGLAPRTAAVRRFRMVQPVGEIGRKFHAAADRCHLAAAVGIAADRRARADRDAAGDHRGLRGHRHSPAGRKSVEHRGTGGTRDISPRPGSRRRSSTTPSEELLRLLAVVRFRGLHAPGGAQPQEHRGVRADGVGQNDVDQGADSRDSRATSGW